MSSGPVERKLVAIVSADVAGYSRLISLDEVATVRTLTSYREAMSELVVQHRGRVVDNPGDNALLEFPSATDAVSDLPPLSPPQGGLLCGTPSFGPLVHPGFVR